MSLDLYWHIALVVFAIAWVAMVVGVCRDAADGAGGAALTFIPLFTMGVAMVATVWPLAVAVLVIYGFVSIR